MTAFGHMTLHGQKPSTPGKLLNPRNTARIPLPRYGAAARQMPFRKPRKGIKDPMKIFKALPTICCLTVMGAVCAPGARADEWNRKTTITFSGPVEIPGVHLAGWGVLPAGTYVFKILDSQ